MSKTRIYTIFYSKEKGKDGWPFSDLDPEERKGYLLSRLKESCPDIEFVGGDIVSDLADLELAGLKDEDAILLYFLTTTQWGKMPLYLQAENLISSFKKCPTLLVSDIYGGDAPLLDLYGWAKKKDLSVLPVSSSSFCDLKKGLHLIDTLHKIKGKHIHNIGESKESLDQSHWWRRGGDINGYLQALKETFGIEVVTIDSSKLNGYYEAADIDQSKKLAQKWIDNSLKVVEPTEEEIVRSARIYYAIKQAMEDCDADAVTIDCLTLFSENKLPAYPCLAFSQLNDDGSTGVCEADMNGTVTQLVLRYLTGRPGFISDPVIDTSTNQIIYAHCVAPTRPFENISSPYLIRSHVEDGKGASIQVILPPNEMVTTVKFNVLERKMAIHQGRTIGNVDEERACRTKLVVETNAKKILENYRYPLFGWHRVTIYGDFRDDLKDLAKLIGFEIVEEDRD